MARFPRLSALLIGLLLEAPALAGTNLIFANGFEEGDTSAWSQSMPSCIRDVGDSFEDNDSAATSAPVSAGAYPGLGICPLDDDFYSIDLSVGDEITVDLTFSHSEGDIDLALADPNATVVASSTSGTDNEQIVFTAAQTGSYIVWVYLVQDLGASEGNDYDMDIDVVPPSTTCMDDSFEDNDSAATATSVSADAYPGLRICPLDDDFYSIDLSVGDEITVDLAFSHSEGDIDLALADPNGTVVASSDTVTDDEQIVYTAEQAGTYIVWVRLFDDRGASEGNDYDMNIAID